MCFFLKRGMGKLWDSMYYLMGGRGVVNNFKNRTVIAALFKKRMAALLFLYPVSPSLLEEDIFSIIYSKVKFPHNVE